jgi:signal transduction histidine kinase
MSRPIDILLVDDEARNLDALEAILESPNYRLLRAQDADRALRLLLENDVAAIVLDIKMPQVDGFELAQMIKNTRRFRETPIVFLTAHLIDDQHMIAGYDAGAVDYLTKPVNSQILKHKIAVFAELFRKTRELAELNEKLEERVKERTLELERSEAALRAAAQQKDEFLAILAHELRNPLGPLRSGLDLLLRRKEGEPGNPGNPIIARTLGTMNRQLHHMVRLIDDLLDISRVSRGLLELKKAPVDLGEVVAATVESLRPMFEQHHQRLTLENAEAIEALADSTRVAQIVTNLLTNASKFTPESGQITIGLEREGDRALIRVADSGAGIPADQIDLIFGMFARVKRADGDGPMGLGIGLALARRLAEMHGGTLTVASPGDNAGSTFTLALPASRSAPLAIALVEQPKETVGATNGLRIVIIEDNEDVAESLKDLLEDTGHTVWAALSGSDGINLVQQVSPNVVLCDLGLPHMGGVEICRRIRALPIAQPPLMVAITGWGREEDHRRTREAGFDHHLVKPVAVDSLDKVLRSVTA